MMHDNTKHVGLDVHKDTIAVAIAGGERSGGGGGRSWGTIENRPGQVKKLVKALSPHGEVVRFYYEAGPCGYGLYRQLTALGHDCQVVAPSLIPRKSGDRIKTDRRDALNLARLGRAGELTTVWVPDDEQEAMRDLMRCREDAKVSQRQMRQQLSGYLLRHGRVYADGDKWTQRFFRWLETLKFDSPIQQIVFQEYVDAVTQATAKVTSLDKQIEESVQGWSMKPMVEALMALRGFQRIAAMTVVAELGDVTRFDSPRQLMAFLGLVPSEHSSGQTTHRGGITKAGNSHVRKMLIESSWCYRHPARKTAHLQRKAQKTPPAVQAIAWKAQKRLCGRYRKLTERGKPPTVVVAAIARELSGFIWAIYQQVMDGGAGSPRSPWAARSGEPSSTL